MRRHSKILLALVALLFLALTLAGQVSHNKTELVLNNASGEGIVVLGGGYYEQEPTAALLKKVIGLAGGGRISLVVIPTADSRLDPAAGTGASTALIDYQKTVGPEFARLGVSHVTVLHTRDRHVADSEAFVEPLRSANCVWIPGGSPQLLFDVYPGTRIQDEVKSVLNRGGVVAGDSAGALLIARNWLSIDPARPEVLPAAPRTGLGLLSNLFVMAHVNRYKSGVVEAGARAYVSSHPEASGILIEEHTAVMIQRGRIARLIGAGRAGIVDAGSHEAGPVAWLSGSVPYDLSRRQFVQ